MSMKELLAIIQEEYEIIESEDAEMSPTLQALSRAFDKIQRSGPAASLTDKEKEAVKYILGDVGELYLYTDPIVRARLRNTSHAAGFDTSDLTQKAFDQAATLGIHLK